MKKNKKKYLLDKVADKIAEDLAEVEAKEPKRPKGEEISFEVYFHILSSSNKKIQQHHYKAMKTYAERAGLVAATREEWDAALKGY